MRLVFVAMLDQIFLVQQEGGPDGAFEFGVHHRVACHEAVFQEREKFVQVLGREVLFLAGGFGVGRPAGGGKNILEHEQVLEMLDELLREVSFGVVGGGFVNHLNFHVGSEIHLLPPIAPPRHQGHRDLRLVEPGLVPMVVVGHRGFQGGPHQRVHQGRLFQENEVTIVRLQKFFLMFFGFLVNDRDHPVFEFQVDLLKVGFMGLGQFFGTQGEGNFVFQLFSVACGDTPVGLVKIGHG